MSFHVGQKVECVDNSPRNWSGNYDIELLTVGAVYTIREIDRRGVHLGVHEAITIRLNEIVRPVVLDVLGPWEQGYHPRRFRPVVERKTDISSLQALLVPGSKITEKVE